MSTQLVETTEKDTFLEVASYIGALLDGGKNEAGQSEDSAGSKFVSECQALYEASRHTELLDRYIAHMDIMFAGSANDKDLDGIFMTMSHLIPHRIALLSPAEVPAAVQRLSAALVSAVDAHRERRIGALVSLYNILADSRVRVGLLLQILRYGGQAGASEFLLAPVRAQSDSWARELGLAPPQERELLLTAAQALLAGAAQGARKARACAREAARLQARVVAGVSASDEAAEVAKASPVAVRLVANFLRSGDSFAFDLRDSHVLALVAAQGSPEERALVQLLDCALQGRVPDAQALLASPIGQAVSQSQGVDPAAFVDKVRLMTLASLAESREELELEELSAALGVEPAEAEVLVVRAVGKRLIEARMDQVAGRVAVSRVHPVSFGAAQWSSLARELRAWKDAVSRVRSADIGGGVAAQGVRA